MSLSVAPSRVLFTFVIVAALSAAEQQARSQRLGAEMALPAGQQRRLAHGQRGVAEPLLRGFGLVGQIENVAHAWVSAGSAIA